MVKTILNIGGLIVQISHSEQCEIEEAFYPFFDLSEEIDIDISYFPNNGFSDFDWDIDVSSNGKRVGVYYNPINAWGLKSLRDYLFHIPMDELLILHNRMILHSSFINTKWGGILFSGNSGIGKSTQAELWKTNRDSIVINGDRAILSKVDKIWRGYGSPYSGSSQYYVRQDEPIRAIVLLEQAEINEVVQVLPAEAFRKLFLQISASHKQKSIVDKICDLLMDLVSSVPVYRLRCTPDVRAVEVLEKKLREEDDLWQNQTDL